MIDRAQVEEALDRWESWGPMSWKHDTAPLAAAARAYVDQEITDEMVKRAAAKMQDLIPEAAPSLVFHIAARLVLEAATRGDTG